MPELIPNVVTPSEADEPAEKTEAPASKPMVGIIYPPPEVRNIVDKTASFVARNGPEFETRIRQNEISNAKFNFLNPGDPYHAYYRHKVKEFQEGKAVEPAGALPLKLNLMAAQPKPSLLIEPIVPKEPPQEFEFIADPPSINAFDLDVVKLTAQFVARNGGQFLTNLMNREQRNYIFDFLRPQHSMFNYFTKLVEQYIKVLIPPKELHERLIQEGASRKAMMEKVTYRVEWEKYQERLRKKDEEEKERERVNYSQIDWHDFVVVETVDYQPDEEGQFPPPLKPSEIGSRILAEERYEQFGEELAEEEDVEMEVEGEDDDDDDDEDEDEEDEGEEEEGEERKVQKKEEGKEEKEGGKGATDLNTEVQDMEEGSDSDMDESDEEKEESAPVPAPPKEVAPMLPPLPPQMGEAIIKKDYNPKMAKQTQPGDTTKYLISPITGEKIAVDKMQEHMRIGLLDPRWVEERSRQMSSKASEEEYPPGASIEESLKNLAERRTDIFGEGDIETQIGKKIGEEEDDDKNKQKVIWDGHTASMESTTRKAQAGITLEDQINAFHKSKGLLPDKEKERIGPHRTRNAPQPPPPKPPSQPPKSIPSGPPILRSQPPQPPPMPPRMPMMVRAPAAPLMQLPARPLMNQFPGPPAMGMPPRMPGQQMPRPRLPMPPPGPPQMMRGVLPDPPQRPAPPRPSMDMDEPPAKRQKTEEDLIPEDRFLATHKGSVMFNVVVPLVQDKPEWKLHGQRITLNMPLTDQVSVIKAKLFEQLGIPAGKQKLQHESLFIKDSNSLAFYNFVHGTVVQLQQKERGGRKR